MKFLITMSLLLTFTTMAYGDTQKAAALKSQAQRSHAIAKKLNGTSYYGSGYWYDSLDSAGQFASSFYVEEGLIYTSLLNEQGQSVASVWAFEDENNFTVYVLDDNGNAVPVSQGACSSTLCHHESSDGASFVTAETLYFTEDGGIYSTGSITTADGAYSWIIDFQVYQKEQ